MTYYPVNREQRSPKAVLILALCSLLICSGCAHRINMPEIDNPQEYQRQLSKLDHWSLEGKISVRHANKSDSAALQWQQAAAHFDIFVSGPLGAGATRITGTPQSLTLHNDKELSTTTDDPDHLIEQHLGWELPLEKLPQWITGHTDSHTARFNTDNTLAGFNENNWQVQYQRYQMADGWLLPEKIILKHEDMQVTIFIKHWQLH